LSVVRQQGQSCDYYTQITFFYFRVYSHGGLEGRV
jgi:hypothetical protein